MFSDSSVPLRRPADPLCVSPGPEGSAPGAPADEEEIGAPQGHLHGHGLGAAPESRRDADDARRPLGGRPPPPDPP